MRRPHYSVTVLPNSLLTGFPESRSLGVAKPPLPPTLGGLPVPPVVLRPVAAPVPSCPPHVPPLPVPRGRRTLPGKRLPSLPLGLPWAQSKTGRAWHYRRRQGGSEQGDALAELESYWAALASAAAHAQHSPAGLVRTVWPQSPPWRLWKWGRCVAEEPAHLISCQGWKPLSPPWLLHGIHALWLGQKHAPARP